MKSMVGITLKIFAVIFFMLAFILSAIIFVVTSLFIIPIVIIIGVGVSCLLLYGFGEVVDKICHIDVMISNNRGHIFGNPVTQNSNIDERYDYSNDKQMNYERELTVLKNKLSSGLITEDEYQAQRKDLIKKNYKL